MSEENNTGSAPVTPVVTTGGAPTPNPVTAPNQIDVNAVNARTEAGQGVPMHNETFEKETVGNPAMTPAPVETAPTSNPVVQGVASRLSERAEEEVERPKDVPQPHQTNSFDLSQLSSEQLSTLKAMLNVTPDQVQQAKGNTRIEIRALDTEEGTRYVVDFKQSRKAVGYDSETGHEYETNKIEVLLDGDTDYTDMYYNEFMELERVPVEVMSTRTETQTVNEGQVVQRETGKLVNKEVKINHYFYNVKLPNGRLVELAGKLANA